MNHNNTLPTGEASPLTVGNLHARDAGLQSRRGCTRVQAYLVTGEQVGLAIYDQAEEHRLSFDGNWTVKEVLRCSQYCNWMKPATGNSDRREVVYEGKAYEVLHGFTPDKVVFANGSLGMPSDQLTAGPGPITLVQSKEGPEALITTEEVRSASS